MTCRQRAIALLGALAWSACMAPAAPQPTPTAAPTGTDAVPVDAQRFEHLESAMKNPAGDPALPRVLLIGDSISIGYTPPVRQHLREKANVFRPPANCQHTGFGLANLNQWLGTGRWDVIHFNWGIWDTHYLNRQSGQLIRTADEGTLAPDQMRIRYDLDQYRDNLAKLVARLKQTNARLIWASTTPVMFRKGERFEDIRRYNDAAAAVMKENGIAIDDLYAFTLPHAAAWQGADQCHFNATGNAKLGEQVGAAILAALQRKPDDASR